MIDPLRQEIATAAETVVVKVGTRPLTAADGTLDEARVARLAEELHSLLSSGRRLVLVSSGAVGAGMGLLALETRPTELPQLQAAAAVGQSHLIQAYERTLRKHGRHAAQILLTAEDLADRARYLNVRNTLSALMAWGAVPIINENDTVSTDEFNTTFGDNDRLAALVTNLLPASLLVILSDVDGLYDRDPADPQAQLVPTVTRIDDNVLALVRDRRTGLSKGGMQSKLRAAQIVTTAGENVIIASGTQADVLPRIFRGESVGTLFLAQGRSISPRKRWIGFSVQPRGRLVLDDGARQAVEHQGRSLLAIGVRQVEGTFAKGDVVALCDAAGQEFARGLTNYSSQEASKIQGLHTDQIAGVLGVESCPYPELIHRDHLALTKAENAG